MLSTSSGTKYNVQFTALNTRLQNVVRGSGGNREVTGEFIVSSMADYEVSNVQLDFSDQDFELKSQCLISLPESQDRNPYMPSIGSCIMLYEVSYFFVTIIIYVRDKIVFITLTQSSIAQQLDSLHESLWQPVTDQGFGHSE